jgi:hypothetical protein
MSIFAPMDQNLFALTRPELLLVVPASSTGSLTSEYPNNTAATTVANGCSVDANCSGVLNTTGVGVNVDWVVSDIRIVCPFDDSQQDLCSTTLQSGKCRNAKEHCLPSGLEGTVQADFVPDPLEAKMGLACVAPNGVDVLTYRCDTNSDGTVQVACTGAAQPQ